MNTDEQDLKARILSELAEEYAPKRRVFSIISAVSVVLILASMAFMLKEQSDYSLVKEYFEDKIPTNSYLVSPSTSDNKFSDLPSKIEKYYTNLYNDSIASLNKMIALEDTRYLIDGSHSSSKSIYRSDYDLDSDLTKSPPSPPMNNKKRLSLKPKNASYVKSEDKNLIESYRDSLRIQREMLTQFQLKLEHINEQLVVANSYRDSLDIRDKKIANMHMILMARFGSDTIVATREKKFENELYRINQSQAQDYNNKIKLKRKNRKN